jgi:hypothetical protein
MTHILGQRKGPVFVCRGCGCDDDHACSGGCEWVLLDIPEPGFPLTGICSACAQEWGFHPVMMRDAGFVDASEYAP